MKANVEAYHGCKGRDENYIVRFADCKLFTSSGETRNILSNIRYFAILTTQRIANVDFIKCRLIIGKKTAYFYFIVI